MADEQDTTDSAKEEDAAEDSTEATAEEENESTKTEGSTEIDLDAELEKEKKRGKPDPAKASDAFKERTTRRKQDDEEDTDKPVTRADLAAMEERAYRRSQADRALEIARRLTQTDKEAQLVMAKWENRGFPADMGLEEQLREAYAITHAGRIIGEREEALRVAKSKGTTTRTAAEAHRDGPTAGEPKMSDADRQALTQGGFVWDAAKRLYKKPLRGGKLFLYKNPQTKQTFTSAS